MMPAEVQRNGSCAPKGTLTSKEPTKIAGNTPAPYRSTTASATPAGKNKGDANPGGIANNNARPPTRP